MNVIYLRTGSARYPLLEQENTIRGFAQALGMEVERTITESAPPQKDLEERTEFLKDIRSMKEGDAFFTASLSYLSQRAGELVKLLDCFFKRNVTLYLCDQSMILNRKTPSFLVMHLLASLRETSMQQGEGRMGRPTGSRSVSQFDAMRDEIVRFLEMGKSVSEISRNLNISRTSLTDYIRSRELKAREKKNKLAMDKFLELPERSCPLQELITSAENSQN